MDDKTLNKVLSIAPCGSVYRNYQENADVIFNSSLIYELPILKTVAEPLLFAVDRDSEEWATAKTLLKFLDFFLGYPGNEVPANSVLREFMGGSCFNVG